MGELNRLRAKLMSFSLFCGYDLPKMDGSNAENGDIWMIIWIDQYHMNTLWESNIAMEAMDHL